MAENSSGTVQAREVHSDSIPANIPLPEGQFGKQGASSVHPLSANDPNWGLIGSMPAPAFSKQPMPGIQIRANPTAPTAGAGATSQSPSTSSAEFWGSFANQARAEKDVPRYVDPGMFGSGQECVASIEALMQAEMPKTEADLSCLEIPKLNKEGLIKMYRYNTDILRVVMEALAELSKDSPNPKALWDHLTTAKQKVMQRLKLIRIADRHGWQAVYIYEGSGDLGESPEDSKKIKAAVAEAERQKKKAESLKMGSTHRFGISPSMPYNSSPFRGRGSWNYYPRRPFVQGPRFASGAGCYICGASSHWARNCPQSTSKMASFTQGKKEA